VQQVLSAASEWIAIGAAAEGEQPKSRYLKMADWRPPLLGGRLLQL